MGDALQRWSVLLVLTLVMGAGAFALFVLLASVITILLQDQFAIAPTIWLPTVVVATPFLGSPLLRVVDLRLHGEHQPHSTR